jgi:hypothetical protein
MKQSGILREHAENGLELADRRDSPAGRQGGAWAALAPEQDLLNREISPLPVKKGIAA